MNSRIIVGGHVGLGLYRANSEHTRLLLSREILKFFLHYLIELIFLEPGV